MLVRETGICGASRKKTSQCSICVPDDPVGVPVVNLPETRAGDDDGIWQRQQGVALRVSLHFVGDPPTQVLPQGVHLQRPRSDGGALDLGKEVLGLRHEVGRLCVHQVGFRSTEVVPKEPIELCGRDGAIAGGAGEGVEGGLGGAKLAPEREINVQLGVEALRAQGLQRRGLDALEEIYQRSGLLHRPVQGTADRGRARKDVARSHGGYGAGEKSGDGEQGRDDANGSGSGARAPAPGSPRWNPIISHERRCHPTFAA